MGRYFTTLIRLRTLFYLVVFFLLSPVLLKHSADAVIIDNGLTINAKIPANLISIQTGYAIIVEKSSQQLYLYYQDDEFVKLIDVWACSSGKNKGDKIRKGDLKTPEGIYYFNKKHNDAQLPSRYGIMAFVTNYPNYVDIYNQKSGNGIWLHGIDRELIPYDSKGCIALTNESLARLKKYIRLYQTPLVIEDTVQYLSLDEQKNLKKEVLAFLKQWQQAWSEKDLDAYIGAYARHRFNPPKGSWQRWRAYKDRLNRKYRQIHINLRNINILRHNDVILVTFYQDYRTESFKSAGFKELYLIRNSNRLKIAAERFTETGFRQEPAVRYVRKEQEVLNTLLKNWLRSWETKNLNAYINHYSASFTSKNMNRDQWLRHKQKISDENKLIKVTVLNPRIKILHNTATITFTQKYISDTYTDYGIKKLLLKNENGQWKIVQEDWEPI